MIQFPNDRTIQILVFLHDNDNSRISKIREQVNVSESHSKNIITELEKSNVIENLDGDYTARIKLTSAGRELAWYLKCAVESVSEVQ